MAINTPPSSNGSSPPASNGTSPPATAAHTPPHPIPKAATAQGGQGGSSAAGSHQWEAAALSQDIKETQETQSAFAVATQAFPKVVSMVKVKKLHAIIAYAALGGLIVGDIYLGVMLNLQSGATKESAFFTFLGFASANLAVSLVVGKRIRALIDVHKIAKKIAENPDGYKDLPLVVRAWVEPTSFYKDPALVVFGAMQVLTALMLGLISFAQAGEHGLPSPATWGFAGFVMGLAAVAPSTLVGGWDGQSSFETTERKRSKFARRARRKSRALDRLLKKK